MIIVLIMHGNTLDGKTGSCSEQVPNEDVVCLPRKAKNRQIVLSSFVDQGNYVDTGEIKFFHSVCYFELEDFLS